MRRQQQCGDCLVWYAAHVSNQTPKRKYTISPERARLRSQLGGMGWKKKSKATKVKRARKAGYASARARRLKKIGASLLDEKIAKLRAELVREGVPEDEL